ncbi:3-isopropylmalate dehydratase large subunit [Micromonospora humidisoli]|uniref:3-isopropylmalate dehydratase large subunit n=1 Tax=Micromonospora humidisoli TaxID=2807622 RepID=A0ABS2JMG4_9ACTN|nr:MULTISPECIES: 3-isopropylmalate dehydratase large subunit [Micromonospora]MBM7086654.1 3-isopropylmalate dehydratase large subunit [Micromonospora humidisoli]GHJ11335.1 3-isopropylmalate dehydratase large subunit [Micromonospora sp. AKA109]
MTGRTLAEKLWQRHVVRELDDRTDLLYIDLHLIHEVSSPQAFEGLGLSGRRVRRPELTLAVEDHNVPTHSLTISDAASRAQIDALRNSCAEHGIELYSMGDASQGIVHVVGPELGLVQPGMLVVCGDSHTSTHGALGALAFGVGTSDVEHVLATQTLAVARPGTMAVEFTGLPPAGTEAKDIILALISAIGTNGAQGFLIEYRGEAVRALSMEGRMTMCNMSIEAGARAGMIAPDDTTLAYLRGRPCAPSGADWQQAVADWETLVTDDPDAFDRVVRIDLAELSPHVTWGTNPGHAVALDAAVPSPESFTDPVERASAERALAYMDLRPGTRMRDIPIDTVFLGSCTNGRIEDLRAASEVLRGRQVKPGVKMLVVPGSGRVRAQAEQEGLHEVFRAAGAEWRLPGCSMCLGMNPDRISGRDRVASTSNRNFEGRQGGQARTHLVSPAVAAATAVAGRLAAPRDLV